MKNIRIPLNDFISDPSPVHLGCSTSCPFDNVTFVEFHSLSLLRGGARDASHLTNLWYRQCINHKKKGKYVWNGLLHQFMWSRSFLEVAISLFILSSGVGVYSKSLSLSALSLFVSPPLLKSWAHPAGFIPSCRSRSSARRGGNPWEGLSRHGDQIQFNLLLHGTQHVDFHSLAQSV